MEHTPTELLRNEHEIIKKVEKTIDAMNALWVTSPEKYQAMVTRMLHFFKEYSDGFHHSKEETILFEEMRNHPDFALSEIIDELEQHHVMFREFTAEIRALIQDDQFEKAHSVLKKYFSQLLDHIAVEDDELFSMAENLFTKSELEKLYFRFKDADLELDEKRKTELEKIPQELQETLSSLTAI